MKVIIVGGAGYIGSHVAKAFLAGGHHVTVFDNLSSGLKSNILPKAKFIQGDIMNPQDLDAAFSGEGFEGLIHLAALKAAGESMEKPGGYAVNNISGSINLIKAATDHHIPNVVFSSTAAVYGVPVKIPIDEFHPVVPENFYGFTKLEIERILDWFSRLKDFKYAALRYFNAAGYDPEGELKGLERNPQNLLPVVMETAKGMRKKMDVFGTDYPTRDGSGVRDYIHVTDLANAHVLAMEYLEKTGENLTVNLGSEQGASVLEIIALAEKITGKKIAHDIAGRRAGDPAELYASSAKAKELLGWSAKFSDLDSLIQTTWNAYLAN